MMKFDGQSFEKSKRVLPQERAIAISVGGSTHAVMMATPQDLEDFAYGFLLTDGVILDAGDIEDVTVVEQELGLDIQLRLRADLANEYRAQKRAMVGPVGCGLCGVESLELAVPELAKVMPTPIGDDFPWQALKALASSQETRRATGALHGAAILDVDGNVIVSREDIGRHNAMDKVIGAMLRSGLPLSGNVMVLSSRVSLDLVIKAVRAGIGTLIARATPSDLAFGYAQKWGLALIAPVFETEYFVNGELK